MKKIKKYILIVLILSVMVGCKLDKKESSKLEKKDKAPSLLSEINRDIQDILTRIEDIEKLQDGSDLKVIKAEISKDKDQDTEGLEKDVEEDNNEKTEDDKKEEEEKKENIKEDKPELTTERDSQILDNWIEIDEKIEKIHQNWNKYEVEGIKKGISTESSNKFKTTLDSCTKAIENRNIIDIYDYGSQSMVSLTPIFDVYVDEIKGSINKIKYHTYQSYIRLVQGRNNEASALLENLEADIGKIRLGLGNEEKKIEILDRTNLSIKDMQNAIKEYSTKLYRMKKDIIIKNLDELEK